jgi:hypothetical protein
MAFLDNSGDIILDAVLTDTGRARLAKGDGTFRIAKFALADDEIDYELYNNVHPSGSAYFDLEILQTPVLEAFTNNAASMKHKLVSIPRTTLLYLPVIKLSDLQEPHIPIESGNLYAAKGMFVVACDKETETALTVTQGNSTKGIIYGETLTVGSYIRVDQGLDCDISSDFDIDADLKETQYIVEIDNRFGVISSVAQNQRAAVSYIDDDNVASYYFSKGTDEDYVKDNPEGSDQDGNQVIKGPRGTYLELKIQSSLELLSSTYLFDQLGGQQLWEPSGSSDPFQYIDSTLRISGATTGSSIDIPIRFAKVKP